MWMKGVGCITEGSLNIQQAKKAGDLVSEVSKVLSFLSVVYSKAYTCLLCYIMWNEVRNSILKDDSLDTYSVGDPGFSVKNVF